MYFNFAEIAAVYVKLELLEIHYSSPITGLKCSSFDKTLHKTLNVLRFHHVDKKTDE